MGAPSQEGRKGVTNHVRNTNQGTEAEQSTLFRAGKATNLATALQSSNLLGKETSNSLLARVKELHSQVAKDSDAAGMAMNEISSSLLDLARHRLRQSGGGFGGIS